MSAPRGASPPCVYRGFCTLGCSTNAKQSVLVAWLPRALRAGAEIRDLAMVGRIAMDGDRATGVALSARGPLALPESEKRGRGRLCDRDAATAFDVGERAFSGGLANSSGLVGKNLMVQGNQAV